MKATGEFSQILQVLANTIGLLFWYVPNVVVMFGEVALGLKKSLTWASTLESLIVGFEQTMKREYILMITGSGIYYRTLFRANFEWLSSVREAHVASLTAPCCELSEPLGPPSNLWQLVTRAQGYVEMLGRVCSAPHGVSSLGL